MCGIFGIWNKNGRPVDLRVLRSSVQSLRHRGPDDEGYLLADSSTGLCTAYGGGDTPPELSLPNIGQATAAQRNLALGFRRLSILDLSAKGHQPMQSFDGRYWIVFNGEVYNFIELRTELESLGYRFSSNADTEVAIAAFATWGDKCFKKFVGMWALAIWDRKAGKIILSRDPFGIKPLYYYSDDSIFEFASEIKAHLANPCIARQIDAQRVYDYLMTGRTEFGGQTLIAGIRELPPAHFMEVDLAASAGIIVRPYWQLEIADQGKISFKQAAERLRDIFLRNIELHMRSDVPVGATLSGGIDSSAIVMAIRHIFGKDLELHTFTFAADDKGVNEEKYADIVARAAGAIRHKVTPKAPELLDDLDQFIWFQDVPFGSTTIYAQHRVFRLAAEAGIKVMLDGQGADEFLAGYRGFIPARIASLFLEGKLLRGLNLVHGLNRLPGGSRDLHGFAHQLHRATKLTRAAALNKGTPGRQGQLVDPIRGAAWLELGWFRQYGVRRHAEWFPNTERVLMERLTDSLISTSLPHLLRYEDRNSMAHSIESRVPFLTTEMVDFVYSLPESYIVANDGTTKAVFREAMRGIVPDIVLKRKDKIGFSTPEENWMRSLKPWVDHMISSEYSSKVPALSVPDMKDEWQAIIERRSPFNQRVWRWVNFLRWAERFAIRFDSPMSSAIPEAN